MLKKLPSSSLTNTVPLIRDSISQWFACLHLDIAAPGLIPSIPKMFSEKIVDAADVNQWRCLELSGQWLENVDRSHLVLASGKVALQKRLMRLL